MSEADATQQEYPVLRGLPVDICIFTVAAESRKTPTDNIDKRTLKSYPDKHLELLLVKRISDTEGNKWALPGGFTKIETETIDAAAIRELKEETNLDASVTQLRAKPVGDGIYLEQMKAYYKPGRDDRGPTPTVAYVALVHEALLADLHAGGDAGQAQLFRVPENLAHPFVCYTEDGTTTVDWSELAFDHAEIISDALKFVQNQILTTTIAADLLPKEFTIAELHQVISAVVPSYGQMTTNFARDLLKTKTRNSMLKEALDEHGELKKSSQYSARPAQLYRFNEEYEPWLSIYPRP